MTEKIRMVDLGAQYKTIKKEINTAILSVIEKSEFVGSRNNCFVNEFEKSFAEYIGVKNCVGVANGTDAIEIVLESLGIGKKDEVIVPALTWISTAEAVSNVGAAPVFVDIHPDYYTINPKEIEKKITQQTKAIIAVHLYGLPAEMDEIMEIAKKHKLFVIEDCAQAHGAEYKGKKVGTFGDAATFSFFPSKNLGAYGDAGCIVTNNNKISEECRLIANHGQIKKNEHIREGRNSRMDGIQAAILSVKLKYLDKWIEERIKIAEIYSETLTDKIKTPKTPKYSKHVHHLYVIKIKNREKMQERLKEIGIETNIHYPTALPLLKPYANKIVNKKENFPIANLATKEILSIPIYPELNKKNVNFIVTEINRATKNEQKNKIS